MSCYLYPMSDLNEIEFIRGRVYADGREVVLEPGQVMVWTVNDLYIRGRLEGILEGIGGICDTNGDMLCGEKWK